MDETSDTLLRIRADLVRAVTRICPSWLASESEDIVQDAMMKAMDILRKSEGNAQLSSSYLRRMAYSAMIDRMRRRRRKNEVPIEKDDGGIDPAAEQASGIPDPQESCRGREIGDAIRDCLRNLVDVRRWAVALHLLGHSVPDIGKRMGWEPKRADNLVYRGMDDLRECLKSNGVTP